MGGAIIQLVAYGSPNIYLTGDPQITFFKSVYKRYTNFSTESIEQDILGNLAPGNFVSVVIGRNGDLLKGLTLQYNPKNIYNGNEVTYENGGIPSNLGNTIFKQIEIEVGGNLIDRQYGKWLTIWDDLTTQSYITPSPTVDSLLSIKGAIGAEPTVSTLYDRMSYNHNQLNTQFNLGLYSSLSYTGTTSLYNGTLSYFINQPVVVPTSGTFSLVISNINNLNTFTNNSTLLYIYYSNNKNIFIEYFGVNTASGVTQFSNCIPAIPSTYPSSPIQLGTNDVVVPAYYVYTGILSPDDPDQPTTNILPTNSNDYFSIRINNPDNNWFHNSKGTLTIYANNQYFYVTYGNPSGNSFYYAAEGYLLIFNCLVQGTSGPTPTTPIVLTSSNIVIPTGTTDNVSTDNLLNINSLINVIPANSGTFTLCLENLVDINSPLIDNIPVSVVLIIEIGGVKYYAICKEYNTSPVYNGDNLKYYYIFNNVYLLNNYPTTNITIPDNSTVVISYYNYNLSGAPSEAYVPLQFWFCRNPGLALPLIALQYHEVKINLQLATSEELHATKYQDVNLTSIKLFAEYVYLDTTERRQFATNAHEYLIDQLQYDTFNNSFVNNLSGGELQININFANSVKEIVFCGSPVPYGFLSQGIATPVGILNTLTETSNVQMQITFNQIARFSDRNLKYFTRNQIWDTHTGSGSSNGLPGEVGLDNIGVYSFSLKPEEHQPSGTCNFSRITNPRLVFSNFDLAAGEKINSLDIFAVSYNIFRIMSGMGNIAYAY